MKKIAKILSVVLCMVMVLGLMATTTFAAETTYTKVTSVDDLKAGGNFVMVVTYGTTTYAVNNSVGKKMYDPVELTVSGGTIAAKNGSATIPVWEIAACGNGISLKGTAYVGYPGSKSDFTASSTAFQWNVTESNGKFKLQANNASDRYVAYSDNNGSNPRVGPYQYPNSTYVFEFEFYKVSGYEAPKPTVATNIKQVLDDATDNKLWTVTGTVTSVNYNNIYIQDETGGILIYKDAFATDPVVGDVITTTGNYDFYGVPELVNCTEYTSAGNTPATAVEVAYADLGDNLCKLVTVKGTFTVTEVYDDNGAWSTPNITAEDENGNKFTLYMAPLTKVDGEWPIAVGDEITSATGVVGYKDGYRIISRSADEIVYTEGAGDDDDITPPAGDDDDKDDDTVVTPPATGTGPIEGIAPVNGATIKLGLWQNGMGKFIYFNGEVAKTYYLGTTEDYAVAVNLTVEQVDGGWLLWFMKDGVKTYVDMVPSGTHINAKMVTDKPTPLTWNATYKTFTKNIEGVDYFFGTYTKSDGTNYTTISCSKLSMLEGDDNYPCHLYAEEPAKTGDISSVFVALLAVSAIGAGALISKKGKFVA